MNYSRKHIKAIVRKDERVTRNDIHWLCQMYSLHTEQQKAKEKKARKSK